MSKRILHLASALLLAVTLLTAPGNVSAEPSSKLIIFHAGSLSVLFAKIEKNFENMYPNVDVLRESGGSTKMARLISEVGKPADAFLAYLLSPDGGLKILDKMGQPPFVPARTDAAGAAKLPKVLKSLVTTD